MSRTPWVTTLAAVVVLVSTACASTAVAPTAPPSAQSAPVTPLPPPGKPTPPGAAVGQASPAAAGQASPAAKPGPSLVAAPAKPAPPPAASAADISAGQQLIAQKGCGGCHTVPGVAGANGKIGPDLAGVGSRPTLAGGAVPHNGPDDIKRWILDPPALKPGTAMPKLGLSDDEATKIAAYLETLK